MDAALYTKILSDKNILDLKKLSYKYPDVNMEELVDLFKSSVYKTLPLSDFNGSSLVYMENITHLHMRAVKLLLTPQHSAAPFALHTAEEEIASTLAIENIDFSRDSVRKILQGYAPADIREKRIYGMKKGLEFIADPTNTISETSLYALYDMAIGQTLDDDDKLNSGAYYRHDEVFIVGQDVEHTGLPHHKLPAYMKQLVAFIQEDSAMNDLLKAATVHFYFAYLHPYFDGNGRMARLLHLWTLRRLGYSSALFVPFSSFIERSRNRYYKAYTRAEENAKLSGVMDITPFLVYFIDCVYNRLDRDTPQPNAINRFNRALAAGKITEKEKDLWYFVLSAYGTDEFSTKTLEKDFGNAAYATIRSFVLKFEALGLLTSQKYSNRVKYAVCAEA